MSNEGASREIALEAHTAAARQRLAEGQGALDLRLDTTGVDGEPLEIVGSKTSHLWDGMCRAYPVLGFDTATGGDEVCRIWCWQGSLGRRASRLPACPIRNGRRAG